MARGAYINVKVPQKKIDAWSTPFAQRTVRRTSSSVLQRARQKAPARSGELRDSGKLIGPTLTRRGAWAMQVEFSAPHARIVHEGMPEHTRNAPTQNNKSVYKFSVGSDTVYTPTVHLPARAPNRFLANAKDEVFGEQQRLGFR